MWITMDMNEECVFWANEPKWDRKTKRWMMRGARYLMPFFGAKDICPKIAPGQKYKLPGEAKLIESHA